MIQRVRIVVLFWITIWITIAGAAMAQTFDSSGNGLLQGTYFLRQVLLSGVSSTGTIARARSIVGTATFDGNGNYTFSGQIADTQAAQPQSYSVNGQYQLAPNGFFQIQNLIDTNDIDFGGVGAVGPSAIVASATEGTYHDVLVAIPAGTGASNGTLQGNYVAGFIDFTGGSSSKVRDGYFSMSSNGQGSLGNLSINGSAADQGSLPTTQTASGVTYALSGTGSGTINFGSSASLLNGTKSLYISSDGNLLLGGSPGGFDLVFGVRAVTPPASNATFIGTYYQAALEEDASSLSQGQATIDSFNGSTHANGQGTSISHLRFDQVGQGVYDYTYDDNFSFSRDGMDQKDFFQDILGANGQVVLMVGRQDEYSLTIGIQTPPYSGPGVFLNPIGIVNSANFAPITNSVAPGEFVTLFGSNLSSVTLQAQSVPLQTNLGGVQVMVNGRAAPIYFVSASQISVIVPYATTESFATFQVINGTPSNKVLVYVAPTAPGVYTQPPDGVETAAALHTDYSLVTPDNPAKVGETLQLFVTGLGAVTPAVADGAVAPSNPLSVVNAGVAIFVDGQQAQVSFKGLAPGFVALYQVNFVVPDGVSSGQVYVDVSTPDAYTSEAKLYVQ
jgi:uncharacterized protein (TIGR03437 family)